MQPPPTEDARATEALTRVGAAAGGLGIETSWLEAAAHRMGTAPARYLRTWLDTDSLRLAIRCESRDALARRPGKKRYVELGSAGFEYELVVGTRTFSEDRALIKGVPAPALDAIDKMLEMLGGDRCDALGRLVEDVGSATGPKIAWTITLVESPGDDLRLRAAKLAAHAHRFGVEPLQETLLQEAHGALGDTGSTVTFTCDRVGMRREVTLEYRDIAWKYVIGLSDALRGTSSESALGLFAAAMGGGETASSMAITYRAGRTAGIRVAVDQGDAAPG